MTASRSKCVVGLDRIAQAAAKIKGRRIGLLCHPASVTAALKSAPDILRGMKGARLTCLFGPQHGYAGEKQDNMIESPHSLDPESGIPIFSLYSETRAPTPEMLSQLDTLVVDLQDVGTRVYTFEWTTALALEACAAEGKSVIVLDRPNPLGGTLLEGNLIRPGYESFVGLYPVPMRHGLTLGEMALFVNDKLREKRGGAACDLEVIRMKGWTRRMTFDLTGLPWILPSPNMPTTETAFVYAGQVLLEGTNLSEGRGTTRPFEIWGAPYLNVRALAERLRKRKLPGCVFREHAFEPTFQKWKGEACRGFQIHVTDRAKFRPYRTTLSLLQDVVALHRDQFEWKKPPFEYVTDRMPIDVLTGDLSVREAIETGADLGDLEESWERELRAYRSEVRPFLLYPR